MDKQNPISDVLSAIVQKVKEMVDANTVVGEPIVVNSTITLLPISKLSFGLASGGSEFTGKNQKPDSPSNFGGGGGAGVKVIPVAFLVVNGENVRLLPVTPTPDSAVERALDLVPELVDKLAHFLEQKQNTKDESAE